jgi:capsular polysaccharide biosynthesis protein
MNEPREPRRRRGTIVAFVLVLVVLGAILGGVSALVRGATYTSEAQLRWDPTVRAQLDPNYSTPDSTTFDRQVADQQDVVLGDSVVNAVARTEDMTAAQVRDAVTVSSAAGTSGFTIAASASTPAEARRIATDVTDQYIASLRSANTATLQQRIDALKPVITTLTRQVAAAGANAGPLAQSLADAQSASAEYSAALADVPVEASVQREPAAPSSPSSLSAFVSALIGAALGLIVGVCVVLLGRSLSLRPRVGALARPAASAPSFPVTMPSAPAVAERAAPERTVTEEPAAAKDAAVEDEAADDAKPDDKDRGRLTPAPPYFG